MRALDTIVIHYTATPPGWSDRYATHEEAVAEIRRWHVEERGWSDIGYHFVIGIDGTVAKGRPVELVGAHVRGHNARSIGIAYIGGLGDQGDPADTRTPEQTDAIRGLLQDLQGRYGTMRVVGHKDLAPSHCPGFDVASSDLIQSPLQPIAPEDLPAPRMPHPSPLDLPPSLTTPKEILTPERVASALQAEGFTRSDVYRIATALEPLWRAAEARSPRLRTARWALTLSVGAWVGVRDAFRAFRG